MAKQQESNLDEAVLDLPTTEKGWIDYIHGERFQVVQPLAHQSTKRALDLTVEPALSKHHRLGVFLQKLQYLPMTPTLKDITKMDRILGLFNNPQFNFPETDTEKARTLLDKWESERWGESEAVKEEAITEIVEASEEPAPKRRRKSSVVHAEDDDIPSKTASVGLPRPDHPIFGLNGIMHGITMRQGKRRTSVLDTRYAKKPAHVHGHNGLSNGAWFPMQLVALFRGAHGSAQGGIYGSQETGAYSIVVSGHYEDLDHDNGSTLLYSGSNSHDNTDPRAPAPASGGTRALQASVASGNPVRVLRGASGKSRWAPECGFRYDGLYRVVSSRFPKNMNGGLYEQFKLVRIDGQPEIDRTRPTWKEKRDFGLISNGYP